MVVAFWLPGSFPELLPVVPGCSRFFPGSQRAHKLHCEAMKQQVCSVGVFWCILVYFGVFGVFWCFLLSFVFFDEFCMFWCVFVFFELFLVF